MTTLLRIRWLAVVIAATPVVAADFSASLTPEEFAEAGLGKLTAAERARLDVLVHERQNSETARVRAETTAQVKADAAPAATVPATGLSHRMKVMLLPGAEIGYERVETRLKGGFRGYQPGTVLTLENGQQWRVLEGNWYAGKSSDAPRKVVIEPGMLGSFFLKIEDGGRPKVQIVRSLQ